MFEKLILDHFFIFLLAVAGLGFFSYKFYFPFEEMYNRSPIYKGYVALLFIDFMMFLVWTPGHHSVSEAESEAGITAFTYIFVIGIIAATIARFYFLYKEYGLKTTLYITAVNLTIAVLLLIVVLLISVFKNIVEEQLEKKKNEWKEKK